MLRQNADPKKGVDWHDFLPGGKKSSVAKTTTTTMATTTTTTTISTTQKKTEEPTSAENLKSKDLGSEIHAVNTNRLLTHKAAQNSPESNFYNKQSNHAPVDWIYQSMGLPKVHLVNSS